MELPLQLIRAIEEDSSPVIRNLLETYFDPNSSVIIEQYKRFEDCSGGGAISAMFSKDGEVRIEISPRPDLSDTKTTLQPILCFRRPVTEGGKSPRTYAALLSLIVAIHMDNQENPQRRG